MTPTRAEAWTLLIEYTQGDRLLKHALAVEAAVRGYARKGDQDADEWGIVALLHDFDYERWPDLEDHPVRGSEILRERGYPDYTIRAILSHADHSGVPRETPLEHTLFACDEMAGFVTAAALVRPTKSILDLETRSVKKRMKTRPLPVPSAETTYDGVRRRSGCRSRSILPTSFSSCASRPTHSGSGASYRTPDLSPPYTRARHRA